MSAVPPRRGAALLAALTLLVLIAIVTLEVNVAAGARRRSVAAAIERTAAVAVAEAGVETARAHLVDRLRAVSSIGRPASSLTLDPWSEVAALGVRDEPLGGLRYSVTLGDAGASLHIGRVSQDQVQRFLTALRIDAGTAERLAAAIFDWRDADDLRRARGAEAADYVRQGRAILPGDAPVRSIATLRHVAGMTDALFERIAPHLIVVGSGRVNINSAPRPVLLTLPGMTEETVGLILRRRQGGPIGDLSALATALSAGSRQRLLDASAELARATVLQASEIVVTSTASDETGAARARIQALVVRDGGARVAWRQVTP